SGQVPCCLRRPNPKNGTLFIYSRGRTFAMLCSSPAFAGQGLTDMKRSLIWISGVACYAALITTCLGATGLFGTVSLPRAIDGDRKAGMLVCNGGFAYGGTFGSRGRG